jgi:Protein of unknown function (DUF1232)
MKSQPKVIEPIVSVGEPAISPLGHLSLDAWRLSGKPLTIDEFIEDRRQYLNSIDVRGLGAFSGRLLDKLKGIKAAAYPGLREAVHVIVRVVESPAAQRAEYPLPRWLAETAFAAGYLLKEVDVIPDHLPGIGLADDALILRRVIERNERELQCILACALKLPTTTDQRNLGPAEQKRRMP